MIHTAIGIYPNGDYKVNGVPSENLAAHINYNIRSRFGRALILDGKVIYEGMGCEDAIKKLESVVKTIRADKDTQPYK